MTPGCTQARTLKHAAYPRPVEARTSGLCHQLVPTLHFQQLFTQLLQLFQDCRTNGPRIPEPSASGRNRNITVRTGNPCCRPTSTLYTKNRSSSSNLYFACNSICAI